MPSTDGQYFILCKFRLPLDRPTRLDKIAVVRVSNRDMGVNLDPNDKVFSFADSGNPGGPN